MITTPCDKLPLSGRKTGKIKIGSMHGIIQDDARFVPG
jgi:hypothetical protein